MHEHIDYRPEGHPDEELVEALEPDQLSATAAQPFPRIQLGWRGQAWFWALRVFVLLVTGLVVYTFVIDVIRGG
jgi:hypothetical protein